MDAGVVEFDALADAVGAGAEDDDFFFGGLGGDFGFGGGVEFVAGVVVGGGGFEFGGAGVDGFEDGSDAEGPAESADAVFAGEFGSEGGDLAVGESVVFGAAEEVFVEDSGGDEFVAELDEVA